nr:MAG TPA: hypothetical protein [Bacteriophage sp.]
MRIIKNHILPLLKPYYIFCFTLAVILPLFNNSS